MGAAESTGPRDFYPRPPRGGRLIYLAEELGEIEFLSTSPAWGTTSSFSRSQRTCRISIHVPRVGDDAPVPIQIGSQMSISIHVPRVGDDNAHSVKRQFCPHFYPRPPRGGRPRPLPVAVARTSISIHVPRVGDDSGAFAGPSFRCHFYPRPPRGGRLVCAHDSLVFQCISIHVPRVGDD